MRFPISISTLFLSLAVLSSGNRLTAQTNNEAPAFEPAQLNHRVVRISPASANSAVEVSVAINPTDTDNIIAGAIMRGYPESRKPNYTFQSDDGGSSWETIPSLNPDNRTQGDDVIVFSEDGTCVHGYICFVGLWEQRPQRASNGIYISRSTDQGKQWQKPVPVIDHVNSKTPMEDKPWFAFDRNRESKHFGNLYCSWTRFDVYASEDKQDTTSILFSRSIDQGQSFQPVIRISDEPGICVDGDDAVEGATPSIGVDGSVFVVWSGPRGMEFDKSTDGGITFGKDQVIDPIPGGWDHDVEGIGRANGMPVTGVDHSQSPHRGRLYVNWIDERNGDKDVFLMSSDDQGATWSQPTRVNQDNSQRDQFFTWMAIDPADGSVNIAYYDRSLTEGTETTLTLARSIDGGRSFTNFRLDQQDAFECKPNSFFGDYIGIDAQQGRVVVAFMHFIEDRKLAISAAIADFAPGTLNTRVQ